MATKTPVACLAPPDQGIFYSNKEKLKTILFYEFVGTAFVTTAYTLSNS